MLLSGIFFKPNFSDCLAPVISVYLRFMLSDTDDTEINAS